MDGLEIMQKPTIYIIVWVIISVAIENMITHLFTRVLEVSL